MFSARNTRFFLISNTFLSHAKLKLANNQVNVSNTLRPKLCCLKIIHILHLRYHPTILGHILKNKQKNKFVYIHEITRLIIMKMEMKLENRSHRYVINRPTSRHGLHDEITRLITMKMEMKLENRSHRYVINRPTSRHGRKYSKYITCLTVMMLIFVKRHLSNIWSLVHEKLATLRLSWKKALVIQEKACVALCQRQSHESLVFNRKGHCNRHCTVKGDIL